MEEQIADNSDNDSVESWTLIHQQLKKDSNTSPANEQAEMNDATADMRSPSKKNREDDTDTDGISIISDEELDLTENNADDQPEKITSTTEYSNVYNIPVPIVSKPLPNIKRESQDLDYNCAGNVREEELPEDYFTASAKTRSYIHKRNNRLSTILNMILIGTIVTTACLAIGHIWGTTDDCSSEMYDSISELLYNMQELQHENYVLKSKIKLLESNKKNRPTYLPMIYESMNFKRQNENIENSDMLIKQTSEFLKNDKANCQCAEQVEDGVENDSNSSDYKTFILKTSDTVNDIDDNIVSLTYETMNDSANNEKEEKPQPFVPRNEYTKHEYKRSISGTHQNTYVGPKEYEEYLPKAASDGYKYKRDKHAYDLNGNGNVSEDNLKKYPNFFGDKKKFDKYMSEEFQKNMKAEDKKHNKYYKQQKKDRYMNEEFQKMRSEDKKHKYKPKLYKREKYVIDETENIKPDAVEKHVYLQNAKRDDNANYKNNDKPKNEKYKNYRKQYKKYNRESVPEQNEKHQKISEKKMRLRSNF